LLLQNSNTVKRRTIVLQRWITAERWRLISGCCATFGLFYSQRAKVLVVGDKKNLVSNAQIQRTFKR